MWSLYREIRIKTLIESPEGFGQTLEEVYQVSDKDWQEQVNRVDNSMHWIFFATYDGEVIGTISGNIDIWDNNIVNINSFFVDSRYRRRGVGSRLFSHLISNISRTPYYQKARLEVVPTQFPAINLYKSFGFSAKGKVTLDLKNGKNQQRLVMEKIL